MACICPLCGRVTDCGDNICVLCEDDIEKAKLTLTAAKNHLGKPYAGMFKCVGEHCGDEEGEDHK